MPRVGSTQATRSFVPIGDQVSDAINGLGPGFGFEELRIYPGFIYNLGRADHYGLWPFQRLHSCSSPQKHVETSTNDRPHLAYTFQTVTGFRTGIIIVNDTAHDTALILERSVAGADLEKSNS